MINDRQGHYERAIEDFFEVFAQPTVDGPMLDTVNSKRIDAARLRQFAHIARLISLGEITNELNHELAHPLMAITNYSRVCSILIDKGQVSEARDMAHRLREQASFALDLIGRFRRFAQKEPMEKQSVDLHQLAQRAIDLMRWDSDVRHVPLELRTSAYIPTVEGEPLLILQVISNLVRNAMDATGESGTPVVVTLDHGGGTVEVYVRDQGTGLTPEVEAHLFEPFFTTKPGGGGIGLALSRRIIESHGGRLWAENNPEGGACFGFTLPVNRC